VALRLLAALAVAGSSLLAPTAASAAPAMFVVRDADSEIFLFGTMHALPPELDWRTPTYDAVYQKAQAVWFEAEADQVDASVIRGLIERYGVDGDRPLRSRLDGRQLKDLKAVLGQGKLTLAEIDHLRPWAAALALSMQSSSRGDAKVESGADVVVTRQARKAAKPIRAFETLEEQVQMFAGLPEAVELKYLTDIVEERLGRRPAQVGSLADAWVSGDLRRLGQRIVDPMQTESPGFYEALLKRRNHEWVEAIQAQLAGEGTQLVNVGALHLLGEDGLPALLQDRGYQVERVQ
jgi:uncharacterized protein